MPEVEKKIISVFFVLILVLFVGLTPKLIYSQTPTSAPGINPLEVEYSNTYKDYLTKQENYNKAHEDYLFKRAQYTKYQTLQSQQDAFTATQTMLKARDEVVIGYLNTLKAKMKAGTGISDTRLQGLNTRIDQEISWFSDHENKLSSAGTLNDLFGDSNEAQTEFNASNSLFYEVLSTVADGKVSDYASRTDDLFSRLKMKLDAIRTDTRDGYSFSPDKFQTLDRWVYETDGRITRSKEKSSQVDVLMLSFAKKGTMFGGTYNSIISVLGDEQLLLNDAFSFMKEIIISVKTED